jgi:hypothetical protein
MERLLRETREAATAILVTACLIAGVAAAAFYTFGPEGWLPGRVRALLEDPGLGGVAGLAAVLAAAALAKRRLDRHTGQRLNNLLVGAVALGGLVVLLLQGLRLFFL